MKICLKTLSSLPQLSDRATSQQQRKTTFNDDTVVCDEGNGRVKLKTKR